MRLADEITVIIAKEAVTLRPSLRCAIRLERRPGSFQQLTRDIMDGSLTAAVEVIQDHTDLDFLPNRILDDLDRLKPALLRYVMACAGVDPHDAPKALPVGKPAKSVPFRDHLIGLYRIAAGWLGWPRKSPLMRPRLKSSSPMKAAWTCSRPSTAGAEISQRTNGHWRRSSAASSPPSAPSRRQHEKRLGSHGHQPAQRP